MNGYLDWAGVLTGQPLQWIISGFLTTLYVTLVASVLATVVTLLMFVLRNLPGKFGRWAVASYVSVFRNTPLLVQLFFWYFAAYGALPQVWRNAISDNHPWATFPGNVAWLTPEFLCAAWGLALFTAAFLIEEVQAGLNSVAQGQREAAVSQGFSQWQMLRFILLPQGVANAWQPIIGQYLNLMKLSSLASAIGFSELTYQVGQVESYNAHALAAFAVGTLLYLGLGVFMGGILLYFGPVRAGKKNIGAAVDALMVEGKNAAGIIRHER